MSYKKISLQPLYSFKSLCMFLFQCFDQKINLKLFVHISEINISVSIHSTPIIEGQNTGMIECSYIRNDTGKEPRVTWMKDNVMVSNVTFPFLTANQTCLNSTCNSTLVFQQIDILTKGRYHFYH